MSVKVTIQEVDGVSVVGLNGRIVLGEESVALRETVKGLMAAGKKKVVLNMSNVTYIDSARLGILVATYVSAKTRLANCAPTCVRLRASEVPTRLCELVLRKGCRSLARRTTRISRRP